MQIEIDDKIYEVEIIKKNNRNTYIRVKNGKIIVTTNYLTPRSSIVKLINDNKNSLIKMINTDNKKQDKKDNFYLFGKQYDVIYGFNGIEIDNDKIYAPNKKELDKYILNEIKKIYQIRLDYWYNVFEEKIPVPNLKIRKMTSRWGVCNIRNHNVTLNYELSKYGELNIPEMYKKMAYFYAYNEYMNYLKLIEAIEYEDDIDAWYEEKDCDVIQIHGHRNILEKLFLIYPLFYSFF